MNSFTRSFIERWYRVPSLGRVPGPRIQPGTRRSPLLRGAHVLEAGWGEGVGRQMIRHDLKYVYHMGQEEK